MKAKFKRLVTDVGMSCEGDDSSLSTSIEELKSLGWDGKSPLYELNGGEDYCIGFELPRPLPKGWKLKKTWNSMADVYIDGECRARVEKVDVNSEFVQEIFATTDAELVQAYFDSSWREAWTR